jgi:hypothetical protein
MGSAPWAVQDSKREADEDWGKERWRWPMSLMSEVGSKAEKLAVSIFSPDYSQEQT